MFFAFRFAIINEIDLKILAKYDERFTIYDFVCPSMIAICKVVQSTKRVLNQT
jgi:hypothetical protein